MGNIYSLQHLRNAEIYGSKDEAIEAISGVSTSDGSIVLARYSGADGNIKTIMGVNYSKDGIEDPNNKAASYTIYDSDADAIKAIEDKLGSLPTEFKTVNGETILGSGDIEIKSGVGMNDPDGGGEKSSTHIAAMARM